MADDSSSSSSSSRKSAGLAPGTAVTHVSGERYVVLAAGAPVTMVAEDGTTAEEPTYVLIPESSATHPQPASLLTTDD